MQPKRRGIVLKRAVDIGLSVIGLLLSAPLWPLIAICIKARDGGPVFYGQTRVGLNGSRIILWKFRSMVGDADARLGPLQAQTHDQRVTGIGRFLRSTALDELPQLWNILRGEMSFVGPRPLLPAEMEADGQEAVVPLATIPGYEERHRLLPGLTGIAQVYAPRTITRRHKFKFDLLYVNRQSLWLDFKLIVLSCCLSLQGKCEQQELWRIASPDQANGPRRRHKRRIRARLQPARFAIAMHASTPFCKNTQDRSPISKVDE
ncbi:MAG: sugar transferase [Candidatus Tectomicrobia bacterium]|nr:sugar transferase [Candidatus Tectomicrobia bacterium]